jgi:hypothetical protein
MATERLPMRRIREILRLRRTQGLSVRETARALGVSVGVVSKTASRAEKASITWEVAKRMTDAALEERMTGVLRARATTGRDPTPCTCTRNCAVPASRWGAASRVPRTPSDGTAVHGVLRRVPAVARDGERDDATGAQGRREVHRRLLGQGAGLCQPNDRSMSAGGNVRRGARSFESHVSGGDAEPEGAKFRAGARPCAEVFRRRAGAVGAGPTGERSRRLVPLRARHPAHACGLRSALRLGGCAGAAAQATRQSQGRSGGARRAALDPRGALMLTDTRDAST